MDKIVNLFHEIGMLSQIPRSGFAFLGSGSQSVAEHSFRVATIAHILSRLVDEKVDGYKLLLLCLYHDLPESRIGDLNYMQKKYVKVDLTKALEDIAKDSSLGSEIVDYINEYEKEITIESKLAHDADQLELLLVLKQEQELGNPRAADWYQNCVKRLKTKVARQLAEEIYHTSSDAWWYENKEDPHWIDGGKSKNE